MTTGPRGAPRALVVVPTRELAIQVADDLRTAAVNMHARVLTVYGGRAYEPQIDALTAGVDIVVGTPGRLLDLAERRHLDLAQVKALVLDEADKMLDLGFLPDVERIVKLTPATRQTMLFSATMPGDVVTLARRHMRQPTHIRAEGHDEPAPAPRRAARVPYPPDGQDRGAGPGAAGPRPGLTMVFCQTKRAADQVATAWRAAGFAVATVHGDLGQGAARAGAAGVPQRQGRRAHRHRGRRPRPGRGRRDARDQLRVPGRREDLRAPHRPDRPRRRAPGSQSRSSTGGTCPAGS